MGLGQTASGEGTMHVVLVGIGWCWLVLVGIGWRWLATVGMLVGIGDDSSSPIDSYLKAILLG